MVKKYFKEPSETFFRKKLCTIQISKYYLKTFLPINLELNIKDIITILSCHCDFTSKYYFTDHV